MNVKKRSHDAWQLIENIELAVGLPQLRSPGYNLAVVGVVLGGIVPFFFDFGFLLLLNDARRRRRNVLLRVRRRVEFRRRDGRYGRLRLIQSAIEKNMCKQFLHQYIIDYST